MAHYITLPMGDALSDFPPTHFTSPDLKAGELPGTVPEPNSLPALQVEEGLFERSCPYYYGASSGLPKFRFVECFGDNGSSYIADSYGGRDFINVDDVKPCSVDCRCWKVGSGSRDFSFIAYKSLSELRIAVHDPSLYQMVAAVTGKTATSNYGARDAVNFNGLAVLAKYTELKRHLDSCLSANQELPEGALALNLLVSEFLTDADIFRKFGFESLYERGYLPFELWNTFQRRQLDDDVTLLDDSFNAYADELSLNHLDQDVNFKPEPALLTMNLKQAASCGNDCVVRLLLSQGVHVDQDDGDGHTPLVAAALRNHDSTVRLLLSCGARVDGYGSHPTALERAARAGHESTVQLLLSRGASVEGRQFGLTPMAEAAARGCDSMVSLLLEWGAAIDGKRENPGRYSTPLEEAATRGYDSTVRFLVDKGARYRYSAFLKAVTGGHESTARLLLDSGSISSSLALGEAAARGDELAIRLLLDQGVAPDGYRFEPSPLYKAATGGHEASVRLLLDRGAAIDGNGLCGCTPLSMALEGGHEPTVDLLRSRGAKRMKHTKARETSHIPQLGIRFEKDVSPIQIGGESDSPELPSPSSGIKLGGGLDRRSPTKSWTWPRACKETPLQQTPGTMAVCHRAFIHEFEKVKKTLLQDNNVTTTIQRQFSNSRTTWHSGIKTLRGISDGRLSQDLGELLAFLCVCKATSETLDLLTASEYTESFFADLRRWGIVFDTQGEFDLYKDAVRAIWGVDLTLPDAFMSSSDLASYSTLMMYSQGMALSLMGAVGGLIGRTGRGRSNGLEQSQKRWRERQGIPAFLKAKPIPATGSMPGIPFPETTLLQSEISDRVPPPHSDPRLAVLWMGAIFAILLIFLSWLRNQHLYSHAATVLVPSSRICSAATNSRDVLMGCCEVLEAYLGLRTLKPAFEAAWAVSHQSDEVNNQQTSVVSFSPPGTSESVDAGFNVSLTSMFVASAHTAVTSPRVEVPPKTKFCEDCRRSFITTTNYGRHMREVHKKKKFGCRKCRREFTRRDYLTRHSCRASK